MVYLMKSLYFDCSMGAAGDMLTGALIDLLEDPDTGIKKLNSLGLPGIRYERETTEKCGIRGTHIHVLVNGAEEGDEHHEHHTCEEHHHHHHSSLHHIAHIAEALPLEEAVKQDILAVFTLVAEAESRVHGVPVPEIHFHEVGTMDAVADITAVCVLLHELAPDEIIASPVHVGAGSVHCAHGILPVPAPATAEILKNVPMYGGKIKGELCTPTGAALLKYFATRFGDMPVVTAEKIGYGMGTKDFEQANCLRAILGHTADDQDIITELSCNIDDMTGEDIGYAMEKLLEEGARDVFTTPIGMKKNRPGTMLSVLCEKKDARRMAELIFRHTTTIGIREAEKKRYILSRTAGTRSTLYGSVNIKQCCGYGVSREKIEHDDLARIADDQGKSILQIRKELENN